MNIIDIICLCALFLTIIIGLTRGFVREVSSILAWVVAITASFWEFPLLVNFFKSYFNDAFVSNLLAGACVFVITFIVVSLIGTIITNFVRKSAVSGIDRSFGGIVGGIKGIFILCCLEIVASCFIPRGAFPEIVQKSFSIKYVVLGSDFVSDILPKKIKNYLKELENKNSSISSEYVNSFQEEAEGKKEKGDSVEVLGTLLPKVSTDQEAVYTQQQRDQLNKIVEQENKKIEEQLPPKVPSNEISNSQNSNA